MSTLIQHLYIYTNQIAFITRDVFIISIQLLDNIGKTYIYVYEHVYYKLVTPENITIRPTTTIYALNFILLYVGVYVCCSK